MSDFRLFVICAVVAFCATYAAYLLYTGEMLDD